MSETLRPIPLEELLYRESEAMLDHALKNGLPVPPAIINDFYKVRKGKDLPGEVKALRSIVMSNTPDLNMTEGEIHTLARVHAGIAKIIAPARPQTILFMYLDNRNNRLVQGFGSIPLLRRFLGVAALCIILMILLASSPLVSSAERSYDLFESSGVELILNAGFLLAAAGLGAAFSGLFKARAYVTNYTYDPNYEASYWIEFALGLMAGLILSEVIYPYYAATAAEIGGKLTLAMLGGFSGIVVYRILNRMVYALEALVRQRTEDILDTELRRLEFKTNQEIAEMRVNLTREISKIQSDIARKDIPKAEINAKLDNLLDDNASSKYRPVREAELPGMKQGALYRPNEDVVSTTNLDSPEHDDEDYLNFKNSY